MLREIKSACLQKIVTAIPHVGLVFVQVPFPRQLGVASPTNVDPTSHEYTADVCFPSVTMSTRPEVGDDRSVHFAAQIFVQYTVM